MENFLDTDVVLQFKLLCLCRVGGMKHISLTLIKLAEVDIMSGVGKEGLKLYASVSNLQTKKVSVLASTMEDACGLIRLKL